MKWSKLYNKSALKWSIFFFIILPILELISIPFVGSWEGSKVILPWLREIFILFITFPFDYINILKMSGKTLPYSWFLNTLFWAFIFYIIVLLIQKNKK